MMATKACPVLPGARRVAARPAYAATAALPMPAGAKRAGELNDRAKKEQDLGPQAFDLLRRMSRADQRGDFNLVGVLIVEARGLIVDAGGAL